MKSVLNLRAAGDLDHTDRAVWSHFIYIYSLTHRIFCILWIFTWLWLNGHYPWGLDRSCAAGRVDVRMRTGLILVVLQPPSLCSDSMEALCWAIRRYFSLWARGGDTLAPAKLRSNLLLDICWTPGITRRAGAPRCCKPVTQVFIYPFLSY